MKDTVPAQQDAKAAHVEIGELAEHMIALGNLLDAYLHQASDHLISGPAIDVMRAVGRDLIRFSDKELLRIAGSLDPLNLNSSTTAPASLRRAETPRHGAGCAPARSSDRRRAPPPPPSHGARHLGKLTLRLLFFL